MSTVAARSENVRSAGAVDRCSWAALVDRHIGLVHGVCWAYGLDERRAEQVNRAVWLRLAEHLPSIRRPEALGRWIAAMTRYECLQAARSDASPDEPHVRVEAARRGRPRNRVGKAITSLGPLERRVLGLRAVEPMPSYAEVGAALALCTSAVAAIETRGLEQIRARLAATSTPAVEAGVGACAGSTTGFGLEVLGCR